ncbi:putative mitochondrial carrier C17H9.08 [Hypsizygus marmoreus]|uniref:Mitochondrial carrier C17H9.08 n=1 Tax=Hypsizygus marmoreus TaxID=39966 RepID=A0A369K2S0_HYPMA|nr:putative mitochondrial carrier C17H9.08 [Hypsizygus marmoreus]
MPDDTACTRKPPARSSLNTFIRSTIAGGIAGGVAKTAVAPLDRIKILFQTHHHEFVRFSGSWSGAINALRYIIQTQGFSGLYRGHSLTLARAVPHAAVGYTVYDHVRKVFMPTKADQTSFRRFLAGSVAGVSVLPFTYPFELVRVRMAMETKRLHAQPRLASVFAVIYRENSGSHIFGRPMHGIFNFYPGFAVTLLGTVPYRGGIFLVWETLNSKSQDWFSPAVRAAHGHKIHLLIGAIAGTSSQIVTYPLEVVRRIQQASVRRTSRSVGSHAPSRMGFRETTTSIWRRSGWRGFYAGLGVGLVKQVPMHSISLAVWQTFKDLLDC